MKKINNKILSIPPFISTSWSSVKALHMKNEALAVHLNDGAIVEIPHLDKETINLIFTIHASIIEQNQLKALSPLLPTPFLHPLQERTKDTPIRFAFGNLEDLTASSQHNPLLANSPLIPQEILQKIVSITKMIAPQESVVMGNPEPNCNCVHCQLSRAFSEEKKEELVNFEEEVTEQDLQFSEWHIIKENENLYTVTNKLNNIEKFNVFLGDSVGCTCGKKGCEHLIAVLKS